MRGRLINAFLLEIGRLDQEATAADPDGAGPLLGGYDDVYRETVTLPSSDRIGEDARVEKELIRVPAQLHSGPGPGMLLALKPTVPGNASTSMMQALINFKDLEEMGLVEPVTQNALLKVGDRLHAIYKLDGTLVQEIMNPPGLFCIQATPIFGLGRDRNLLEMAFESRAQGQAEG